MEDFNPTKEQLAKAKRTLIYLINHDLEVARAIKNVFGRKVRQTDTEFLSREQVINRIRTGCAAYPYKNENRAYRLAELHDRFKEYSTHDVRRMIEDAGILEREVQKRDEYGRNQRYLLLNLN